MNNKVVQVARYSTISYLFKALQSPVSSSDDKKNIPQLPGRLTYFLRFNLEIKAVIFSFLIFFLLYSSLWGKLAQSICEVSTGLQGSYSV